MVLCYSNEYTLNITIIRKGGVEMNILKKVTKTVVALSVGVAVLVGTAVPTFASNKHTVTFMYGTKIAKVVVDDGGTAVPPTDTYVPGYNFLGWVGNATNVKSDITILGAYAAVAPAPTPAPAPAPQNNCGKTYTVRFVDTLTGGEYYKQTVSDGANANAPEVPVHPGYHFNGYSGSFENVHADTTIYCYFGWDFGEWHDDPNSNHWWLWDDGDGNPNDEYQQLWWLANYGGQ